MKVELIDQAEYLRRTEFWVQTTFYECPVCGKGASYRERILYADQDKPEYPNKFREYYDYCDVF